MKLKDWSHLGDKVEAIIKSERYFLNREFNLDDIAHVVGSNRSYVSRVINERFHEDFRVIVARLRLDWAKKIMLVNPTINQKHLAEECGFSSAANFNSRFRKEFGLTPQQWIEIKQKA